MGHIASGSGLQGEGEGEGEGEGGGEGEVHGPGVEPTSWHAALAKHLLLKVLPSGPQTGWYSLVQIGRVFLQGGGAGQPSLLWRQHHIDFSSDHTSPV